MCIYSFYEQTDNIEISGRNFSERRNPSRVFRREASAAGPEGSIRWSRETRCNCTLERARVRVSWRLTRPRHGERCLTIACPLLHSSPRSYIVGHIAKARCARYCASGGERTARKVRIVIARDQSFDRRTKWRGQESIDGSCELSLRVEERSEKERERVSGIDPASLADTLKLISNCVIGGKGGRLVVETSSSLHRELKWSP